MADQTKICHIAFVGVGGRTVMAGLVKTALDDFRRSVEITRDVRFQANLRLARRQRASSYVVAFLSLYVIGLSLIPNIIHLEPYQNQILLACSIILSVFVIFTALIDGAQNFYHQGELLHQCARHIAAINHKLKNIDVDANEADAKTQLELLQEEYQKALDECPINHENVDYYREIIHKPWVFPREYPWPSCTIIHRTLYGVRAFVIGHGWILPHILAIIAVTLVVYAFIVRGAVTK